MWKLTKLMNVIRFSAESRSRLMSELWSPYIHAISLLFMRHRHVMLHSNARAQQLKNIQFSLCCMCSIQFIVFSPFTSLNQRNRIQFLHFFSPIYTIVSKHGNCFCLRAEKSLCRPHAPRVDNWYWFFIIV